MHKDHEDIIAALDDPATFVEDIGEHGVAARAGRLFSDFVQAAGRHFVHAAVAAVLAAGVSSANPAGAVDLVSGGVKPHGAIVHQGGGAPLPGHQLQTGGVKPMAGGHGAVFVGATGQQWTEEGNVWSGLNGSKVNCNTGASTQIGTVGAPSCGMADRLQTYRSARAPTPTPQ